MATHPDPDDADGPDLIDTVRDPGAQGDPAENVEEIGEPFIGNNA